MRLVHIVLVSGSETPGLHCLDDKEQRRLRRIIDKHTLAGASRLLNLTRPVLAAAAAGCGIRRGSINLVREAMNSYEAAK